MGATKELERAERVTQEVEDLETIEEAVCDNREALRTVHRLLERRLEELVPVRFSVAASLLGLSVPTIRRWASLGLLGEVDRNGVDRVPMERVLALRPIVRELKRLGKRRHLLEAVLVRIDDRRTLADQRLLESFQQMRRGELVDITPTD